MLKFKKDFKIFFILSFLFLAFINYSLQGKNLTNKIIEEINLEIENFKDQSEIRKLILIKEGEKFSLKKIRDSVKLLYKTGLFSDIKVRIKEVEKNKIELIFSLEKKFLIKKIKFQWIGSKEIGNFKINAIKEGDFFSNNKLKKACNEIREKLREEGYFFCRVDYEIKRNFKKSEIEVYFKIYPGNRLILRKINFVGNRIFTQETLKKLLRLKEGDYYNPFILRKDIKAIENFFHKKKYYRCRVELKEKKIEIKKGYVEIEIEIDPGKKIDFVIKGAKIPLSLILPFWKERVFEEWALTEGEAKILSFLREKGYIFASVTSGTKKEKDKLIVIYSISPGQRYRPGEIVFHGVKHFSLHLLKEKFKLKTRPIEFWIDGNKVFNLPEKIKNFYQSQGYSDVKVTMNFQKVKNKLNVLIYINEGEISLIKQINFIGVKSFSREELLKQIRVFEGGPYYEPLVQADISRLEIFYLNNGFREVKIKAEIKKSDRKNIVLNFIIYEGKRIKVERIIIVGNLITKKTVIRRELKIKEGDYAYYNRIIESRKGLEELGIFDEIKIEEIPINEKSEYLMIRVKEGRRNYIGFGIGLMTKREPYSFAVWNFEIMPRVTLEFSRNNVFGSASLFSFITQVGPWEKRGVLSWEQPYFFSLPFKSFINAWIEEEDRKSFDYNKRGISLTNIKRLNGNVTLLYRVRWTRTTLFNLEIAESEVDKEHRPFSASSMAGTFIMDKRDDSFNPEKGFFLSITSELAYPILGTKSKYFKNFLQFQNYIPLASNLNFSLTTRIGLAWGKIPVSERFFAGGSNSHRGERFDELGPKDPISLKPIGGKALILFNFELKFPISGAMKNLYAGVFLDTGNLFSEPNKIRIGEIRNAIGVGIRYKTPMGPVRIDLGWDIVRRRILPFLTIGNVF